PTDRDGGAIYGVQAPLVNACKPPLVWQSYDIEFTAPKEEPGGGGPPARVTGDHNRLKGHGELAVTTASPGSLDRDLLAPGPVLLQCHRSPVQFRNIWLLPLKD